MLRSGSFLVAILAPQDDLWFGLSSTEKRRLMWCSYWLYSGEELTESCSKEQKRRKNIGLQFKEVGN